FDHLDRLAVGIEDRVVAGLDPDLAPALAEALKLGGDIFPLAQPLPEAAVVGAGTIGHIAEHAVMPAHDLAQLIADESEKILIGPANRAIEVEFDDGLRPADRGDLRGVVG